MRLLFSFFGYFFLMQCLFGQANFTFDASRYNNNGQRVALVDATADSSTPSITLHFRDYQLNTVDNIEVYRRPILGGSSDWILITSLNAGSQNYTDENVVLGESYEYQVKKLIPGSVEDAATYLVAGVEHNQYDYKGQMILLIDETMIGPLSNEIYQLKQDLTGAGFFVNEITTPRVEGWHGGAEVVNVRQSIIDVYNAAPAYDKPTHLFMLGHVPVPRSGLGLQAPDGHVETLGARGADTYYADIDGVFTDNETFDPGNLNHVEAPNLPNDYKWDQDHIPSELEMAFGRIDFADINSQSATEVELLKSYLKRLHDYKHVIGDSDMGDKTAFYYGYDNSNDGSFRSLVPISGIDNVYEIYNSSNMPQTISQNGPYQLFMQNRFVPDGGEWNASGMDATIFSSDQSYWGFWCAEDNGGGIGHIRGLLAKPTKCLSILWTTTAVNIFHQMGLGETLGFACKRIMDHNENNNLYEKPQAEWDTQDWWNRNHMQVLGDPTIRINQVRPASSLSVTEVSSSSVQLNWTASIESDLLGYHVYKSESEFGQYLRISSDIITSTTYIDDSFSNSDEWYMVRAIKLETTGSGSYLNPSQGIVVQSGMFSNSTNVELSTNCISIYPCPANEYFIIEGQLGDYSIEIIDASGNLVQSIPNQENKQIVNITALPSGVHFVKMTNLINAQVEIQHIIKE